MYSTEAPMAIRLTDPRCVPEIPAHRATTAANGEKEVVIRAANAERPVRCDVCGKKFSATGPTAFADDEPLCDLCVFEHDAQLAMVLAALSVLRAFGSDDPSPADREAALDLLAFARLYDAFAANYGPRREPHLPPRGGE